MSTIYKGAGSLTPQSIEHTTVARPRRNELWLKKGFEEATLVYATECSLHCLHNHGGKEEREQRDRSVTVVCERVQTERCGVGDVSNSPVFARLVRVP